MTAHDALLPATVLQRKAVVYVRQSTPQQVQSNLESQRRQYGLVDVARRRGFTNVEIIDDDLGRSASGAVDRPGFDRLVAALCAGQVGAVLCLDADDLSAAWKAPRTTMRTRQRLVRALITEIVADVDEAAGEIVLVIHWKGGQHSELRVRKPRTGEHGCSTPEQALAVMRSMAGRWSDQDIAASLNRMGMPTGQSKTWTAKRVSSLRRVHGIHGYRSADKDGEWLTMRDAAAKLGVSHHQIRKLIEAGVLVSEQIMPDAPHQIRSADLASEQIGAALKRKGRPCRADSEKQISMFPDT